MRSRGLLVALAWGIAACAAGAGQATEEPPRFDGARALHLVEEQLAFGPRVPGSAAHAQAVEWMAAELEARGWQVDRMPFSPQGQQGINLLASSGDGESPAILLGAHYDSRPISDHDLVSPESPVPGANDGASGVAVLLELARVLPEEDPPRPVWLAFFDLEDGGGAAGSDWILGSRALAANLPATPGAAVIVDMIGDADLQIYYELNSDPILRETIWGTAASLGYASFIASPGHSMIDDHVPFLERGIPTVLIIDFDYPYYHTTEDTLDKVSAASLEQVGRTLETWILAQP
jgi:hypothetical protein